MAAKLFAGALEQSKAVIEQHRAHIARMAAKRRRGNGGEAAVGSGPSAPRAAPGPQAAAIPVPGVGEVELIEGAPAAAPSEPTGPVASGGVRDRIASLLASGAVSYTHLRAHETGAYP
eukprot:1266696-Pyramimonas_sp.AAC.1